MRMQKVFDAANYCSVNSVPSILALDKGILATSKLVRYSYRHILSADDAAMAEIDKKIKVQSLDMSDVLTQRGFSGRHYL